MRSQRASMESGPSFLIDRPSKNDQTLSHWTWRLVQWLTIRPFFKRRSHRGASQEPRCLQRALGLAVPWAESVPQSGYRGPGQKARQTARLTRETGSPVVTPPEVTNTGPGFNRGSWGGARGCGFEERVGAHARSGGPFPIAASVCLCVCVLSVTKWQFRSVAKAIYKWRLDPLDRYLSKSLNQTPRTSYG